MAKKKKQTKKQQVEAEEVGLGCLSDRCLAQIVEGDIAEFDELKTDSGLAAFAELCRRDPNSHFGR